MFMISICCYIGKVVVVLSNIFHIHIYYYPNSSQIIIIILIYAKNDVSLFYS
jgi:hypothetical protein